MKLINLLINILKLELFLDISKAFNEVWHKGLKQILKQNATLDTNVF